MTPLAPSILHRSSLQQPQHVTSRAHPRRAPPPLGLPAPQCCGGRRNSRGPPVLRAASGQGSGGGSLEDLDVAVFRFTLGIPGFDDALIPRVVGAVGAVLLLANHLLSEAPTDAQVRAEALGGLLAAVGLATPTVEQLLKERQPGRGRLAASDAVEGASRVFALQGSLPDGVKQDLAWASFALLRNSNVCGLVAMWEGRAVMARGLVGLPPGSAAGDPDAVLQSITQAFQSSRPQLSLAYLQDRQSIRGAGGEALPCVPSGAQSVLVQPIQPLPASPQPGGQGGGTSTSGSSSGSAARAKGWLMLISERPRALSASERAWAAAVAGKLWAALAEQ